MRDKKTWFVPMLVQMAGLLILTTAIAFFFTQIRMSTEASQSVVTPGKMQMADVQYTPPPSWTVIPRPTATFLPDRGISALPPQTWSIQTPLRSPNAALSFSLTSADAKTITGVARVDGIDTITLIDVASRQMRFLNEAPGYSPQVSGNYVVWTRSPNLYIYDIERGQTKNIDSAGTARDARISGIILVWDRYEAGKDAPAGIWGYDLVNAKVFPVATKPGLVEEGPEISGDWVLYRGKTGKPPMGELWVTNVRTGENIFLGQIFTGSNFLPFVPDLYAIDVPWVVWETGESSKDAKLHLYNLETRQSSTASLPPHGSSQRDIPLRNLKISKGIAILSCGYNCYLGYNIRRNVFFTIPVQQPKTEDDGMIKWAISGDQIVWTWRANANGQQENRVYSSQIVPPPSSLPYP